jgi:hypothetical protein
VCFDTMLATFFWNILPPSTVWFLHKSVSTWKTTRAHKPNGHCKICCPLKVYLLFPLRHCFNQHFILTSLIKCRLWISDCIMNPVTCTQN